MSIDIGKEKFTPSTFRHPDNSKKISANQISGLQRIVKLKFIIDGREVIEHFKNFKLTQSAVTHHEFELILAHDTLKKNQNHNLEEAQEFLGKKISVLINYKDTSGEGPERIFVGVITKVAFSQESGSLGNIVLKGQSPTILLDAAPHTQSFGGSQPVNTGIIAEEVIKQGLDAVYEFRVENQFMGSIEYSSQYNETHYNYLSRLAESYGEQFFYDGEVLHFGSLPPINTPIELVYGSTVYNVSIEMNAVHTKPRFFSYISSGNEKLTASAIEMEHLGDLAQRSYQISQNVFKTESLAPAPAKVRMYKDVTDSQRSAQGSSVVKVMTVSGDTTIPFLFPGCTVDMQMRKPDSHETSYFTRLMVTDTKHEVDARGFYKGSFEAISEGTGFLPKPNFTLPKAEQQIATVISNVDPLNQGRVQVRFDWQMHDTTNFIRVMSPDAGGSGAISQNRGYVAIPEIGDQVMVGYEYSHPDFPFVMGGMFHGGIGLGGGVQNHMRSIQTKSGIKVLMNDNEKSVTILDPSGNTYFMDGKGNITVTAPKNMTFIAGEDIKISAGRNMSTKVGKDSTLHVGNDHTEAISKIYTQASENKNVTVKKDQTENTGGKFKSISSEADIQTSTGDLKLRGSSLAVLQGGKDVKVSKG